MSVLPNLHDVEKRVVIKCIHDFTFFREFYDRHGNYRFATPIRNLLFRILRESKDGTDLNRLILRRKNKKEYKKLVRVYKAYKKRVIKDSQDSLLDEFANISRINDNIELIRKYLTNIKGGDYKEADKLLQAGFKPVDEGLIEGIEVSENLDEFLDIIVGSEERDRIGYFGFKYMDRVTAGIWVGDFILIFGRPGVGKSIFLLNVAHRNRIKGKSFAIITLEMSPDRVRRRYLSRASRLNYTEYFKKGRITGKHKKKIKRMVKATGSLGGDVHIIGIKGDCTLGTLNSIVRKYKVEHGVGLFGVDFIDCLQSGGRSWSEQHELGKISAGLKTIALTHEVGIIGITHMNLSSDDIEEEGRASQRDVGYSQRKNQFCDISLAMFESNKDKEEGLITFQGVKVRDAESDIFFKLRPKFENMRLEDLK